MSIHSGKLISSIEKISSLPILEGEEINVAMEILSLAGRSISADCLYFYRTGMDQPIDIGDMFELEKDSRIY